MKILARTSKTGGSMVPARILFKIYGERFAVTKNISPVGGGGFVPTHVQTGFCIPGILERTIKRVPETAKRRAHVLGRKRFFSGIAKAREFLK